MQNLLLDVNIIVDLCVPRAGAEATETALALAEAEGVRTWVYSGSVQTLEYVTVSELRAALAEQGLSLTRAELHARARELLQASTAPHQWLAALADEGCVFASADPEDEQLIRAMDRFPPNAVRLLTRDSVLIDRAAGRAITPEAWIARSAQAADTPRPIGFIDLAAQQDRIRPQLETNLHRVLHHGSYVMGPEVAELERRLADDVGVEHCVAVSSGTDALLVALMALGIQPGDEVITTPFTFVATAEVVALLGARPKFVDIDPRTYNIDPNLIEAAIGPKTRAIMPVSLYGQCADMDAINAIAERHGLPVIEDAAQSFGATYKGRRSCALSTIGCTSFFPSKPLGGYGDGGACFTNDADLALLMRQIMNHGQDKRYSHARLGINGRLDAMQAAVLLAKLAIFDDEVQRRAEVGARYTAALIERGARMLGETQQGLRVPYIEPFNTSVYAQYTLQSDDRDAVIARLQAQGIPTAVHYPIPLNRQHAYSHFCCPDCTPKADYAAAGVLSLPIHPGRADSRLYQIISTITYVE
jgi:UDP-2-acetamido-2-deoxy-ribo-hexuluronate aminotransferase